MNIILCLDDNNGMLFNNRRQSKDREVITNILKLAEGSSLFIHSFSKSLFENNCIVDDAMLSIASDNDFCFVENLLTKEFEDRIKSVYVFRWNRKYPYDMVCDLNFNDYTLVHTEDFKGYSHEKITLEVYRR